MLEVACLLLGDAYGPEYVERLQRNVHRNLNVQHKFVCYTDGPTIPYVECRDPIMPIKDAPGWWNKIGFFKPDRPRTLFFDLDVIPVGNLTPLAEWRRPFGAPKDVWRPGINSSVMLIDSGGLPEVYEKWSPCWREAMHGDQDWINYIAPYVAMFPQDWCKSYKGENMKRRPTNGCKVVYFHGVPKPDDFREDHWVTQAWKGN